MADSILTLGSYSIFPFLPDYSGGLSFNLIPAFNKIVYAGTVPTVVNNVEKKPLVISSRIQLHSHEDINVFLSFVDDHKGRLKKFWYFLRTTDFTLADNISSGQDTIEVVTNDYSGSYTTSDRIYWILNNGDIYTRRVTNVYDDEIAGTTTITLSSTIATDILFSDIAYIGRVLMVRFDLDSFNFNYHTNSVATVDLRFLELPTETPAT